jgi:fructan beta-fructosidase
VSISDQQYRPQYHFTPAAHWMNDPNGLLYYQGEYHLFYQYHPESSVWGPMHWGHAVSRDLVNWQHLPVALYPDENGAIFSGSAVIDWKNTAGFGKEAMVAIFTHDRKGQQSQSLAFSLDQGRSWTKYSGNPVILPPDQLRDFRDPRVFWYDEKDSGYWVMALASGNYVHFYTSPDIIHWKSSGSFGYNHGSHVGIWETPDLFKLPVAGGSETRWVLTVGVGDGGPAGKSGMQYFIGNFNGEAFISDYPPDVTLWADFGADFYAAQSWNDEPNGRRLMAGWQSNWQYANLLPTTTWRGGLSLIRELSLKRTEQGIRLFQQPISELCQLRGTHHHWDSIVLNQKEFPLEAVQSSAFEVIAEFQANSLSDCFGLRVRVGEQEQTTIGYSLPQQNIFVDRSQSGESSFDSGFARLHSAHLLLPNNILRLHIFVDQSTLEVFANAGQVVFSENIFPREQSLALKLFIQGGEVLLNSLDVYELKPAAFTGSA